ncbi:hypothetical protein [Paraburkholderia sp. CNPSo 3281]|nr:hypothetical protein [Paraburkholderia sp. CNPSo 3281]
MAAAIFIIKDFPVIISLRGWLVKVNYRSRSTVAESSAARR